MTKILSIVFALLIFEIIIVIHEFGHFIVARWNGVKVNEFAIGMGPAIFKKQGRQTLFALRAFPIGGYCAMEGEDQDSTAEGAFCTKSAPRKIAVVSAGIIMNILLGFILLVVFTCMSGPITSTTISEFYDDAVSNASLKKGDRILSVDGMRVFTASDIVYKFQNDDDGVFDMVVKRGGKKVELSDVTFDLRQNGDNKNSLYIDFMVKPTELTPLTVTGESARSVLTYGRIIYISLFDMVRGKYSLNDLSGPVGIVEQIDDVIDSETTADKGIDWHFLALDLISMAALITINIGIFNLLPLPALDGGRLVFLLFELIFRRRADPRFEGAVHLAGMALLLALMLVVTVSDVTKLFK